LLLHSLAKICSAIHWLSDPPVSGAWAAENGQKRDPNPKIAMAALNLLDITGSLERKLAKPLGFYSNNSIG
jgi:hypothetical protein